MRLLFFFSCVIQLVTYCFLFPDELNACQGFLMIIKFFYSRKKVYICSVRKEQQKFNFNLTVNMTRCQ